jgi:hypothetical protein
MVRHARNAWIMLAIFGFLICKVERYSRKQMKFYESELMARVLNNLSMNKLRP